MRRVVVTGLGVVSPIGTGKAAFYRGLERGSSGIDRIQAFDARAFPTRIAGEVTDLNASSVDLPADVAEALRRDPKSLFGLVAGREALRAAFGDSPPTSCYRPERLAVVLASGLEIFNLEDLAAHVDDRLLDGAGLLESVHAGPIDTRLQIPADLGARCLAREAGATGLFAVNVSACAAGTQALGEAFLAIGDGVADAAIGGGYDSMVNPLGVGGFCMLEALSRQNERGPTASRPFDATRDGFVLGEGAAVLVLEERQAALARGAKLYAEILGYGTTLDAYRVTDPAPNHAAAARAMRAALASAGLAPGDVDYVNAHGTGTRKNDPAETAAIRTVFGETADGLPVSSTKSQVGHLIGASGAVEAVAGIFAIERSLLPATINLHQPDPECDLDYVANQPRAATVRTVLSNSFGFGGQNATIIVGAGG